MVTMTLLLFVVEHTGFNIYIASDSNVYLDNTVYIICQDDTVQLYSDPKGDCLNYYHICSNVPLGQDGDNATDCCTIQPGQVA